MGIRMQQFQIQSTVPTLESNSLSCDGWPQRMSSSQWLPSWSAGCVDIVPAIGLALHTFYRAVTWAFVRVYEAVTLCHPVAVSIYHHMVNVRID